MKAEVNQETCIGCGLCAATCEIVFYMADDGLAKASDEEITSDIEVDVETAADGCPVSAITIK